MRLSQQKQMNLHIPAKIMGKKKSGTDTSAKDIHSPGRTGHIIKGIIPACDSFMGNYQKMLHITLHFAAIVIEQYSTLQCI
jgi:hypothetical protein